MLGRNHARNTIGLMVKVATTPPYTCSGHHRASNWCNLEISGKNQLFDPVLSLNFPFEWSERGKAQLNFPTWPLNYPTWSLNYPTWPLNFPTWTLNYPTWTFNYPTHSTLPLDHLTSPLDQLTCPLAHLTSPLDYTKPLLVQTTWFFKRNHSISGKKKNSRYFFLAVKNLWQLCSWRDFYPI